MPLITLHLIQLSPGRTISQYLRALRSLSITPLLASKVVRWIIKPEKLSTHLPLATWDLLIILPFSTPLPEAYSNADWLHRHWSITAGMPKALVNGFEERNQHLLHPQSEDVPELTGSIEKPKMASSTQGLELNDELLGWSKDFKLGQDGALSMLNLLSFKPGKEAHESYMRYGKAFVESSGAKRVGNAKVVGKVGSIVSFKFLTYC